MLRYLAVLFLSFFIAVPAQAETRTYNFDKLHTQILFFVDHMGYSHSNGKFLDFDGHFKLDEAKPEEGSVEVVIKTDSLNMDDKTWDEHVKGEKMFNVAKYPEMTFKSTKVEMTGEKTAKMTGDFTLLGVTKPVTLDVTLNKCEEHPFHKKPACGFDATGTLKRSDFGMSEGIPMVGDEVELRITVEGTAEGTVNE